MSAADIIAEALHDLHRGRHRDIYGSWIGGMWDLVRDATPVDVTALHRTVTESEGFYIYEDTISRPPWTNALLCYAWRANEAPDDYDGPILPEHEFDGTYMVHATYTDVEANPLPDDMRWDPAEGVTNVDHTLDWSKVKWVAVASLLAWRRDRGIIGPVHGWKAAIDADGNVLDLMNIAVSGELEPPWANNPLLVWLKAVTLLNCRNVTLVEPTRTRAQRRRFERDGIRISEIHVFPSGTSVRGRSMPVGSGAPLHSVRGHIARYGPKWGRGLLFGRIEGEFWIPQHARGSAERGTVEQHITVHT